MIPHHWRHNGTGPHQHWNGSGWGHHSGHEFEFAQTLSCDSQPATCVNVFVYNVGYHNEHHDFPKVAGSRLPKVREIAPEYYNNLKYHTSWTKVIVDYIADPNMGPFARTMRKKVSKSD